jgi:hypothetical protein
LQLSKPRGAVPLMQSQLLIPMWRRMCGIDQGDDGG